MRSREVEMVVMVEGEFSMPSLGVCKKRTPRDERERVGGGGDERSWWWLLKSKARDP